MLKNILEKTRCLTIFGYVTAQNADEDTKELVMRSLNLPSKVKYLENEEDEGDRELVLSSNMVKKIHQYDYEESILKAATQPHSGNANGYQCGEYNKRGQSFHQGQGFHNRYQQLTQLHNHTSDCTSLLGSLFSASERDPTGGYLGRFVQT
ncbi:hypothetical protein F4703DRAFT_1936228 [Phycomyces blakesleeanus]